MVSSIFYAVLLLFCLNECAGPCMEIGALLFYGRNGELSMHRPRHMMNKLCRNGGGFQTEKGGKQTSFETIFLRFYGGFNSCMELIKLVIKRNNEHLNCWLLIGTGHAEESQEMNGIMEYVYFLQLIYFYSECMKFEFFILFFKYHEEFILIFEVQIDYL